jgi:hypothetical protein
MKGLARKQNCSSSIGRAEIHQSLETSKIITGLPIKKLEETQQNSHSKN